MVVTSVLRSLDRTKFVRVRVHVDEIPQGGGIDLISADEGSAPTFCLWQAPDDIVPAGWVAEESEDGVSWAAVDVVS